MPVVQIYASHFLTTAPSVSFLFLHTRHKFGAPTAGMPRTSKCHRTPTVSHDFGAPPAALWDCARRLLADGVRSLGHPVDGCFRPWKCFEVHSDIRFFHGSAADPQKQWQMPPPPASDPTLVLFRFEREN